MNDFVFVTGNLDKVHWLEKFLGNKVEHHALDLPEIQSLDPLEVVKHKAIEAFRLLKKPVLVEDTALKFTAMGDLPGPFIKYFLKELGNEGICKLMSNYEDKSATGSVTYGYYDGQIFLDFGAEVHGTISNQSLGSKGHGWDPIFIPNGQVKTFGEMSDKEYEQYSMRNKAVQKLSSFLAT